MGVLEEKVKENCVDDSDSLLEILELSREFTQ
jgi:hypothetical protein